MFEKFKPASRPENRARDLHPIEIEGAAVRLDAAQTENLGNEIGDQDLKSFSDEDLIEEATKNWSAYMELDASANAVELTSKVEAVAEEEFARLQADKENQPVEVQAALRNIEHSLEVAKHDGFPRSVMDILISYSKPDIGHVFEPDRTLRAFSPEIQDAVRSYFEAHAAESARLDILSNRALRFNAEKSERGIS